MKAWILDSIGSLDNLRLAETAAPTPAAGEVVLRVEFAALNPADRYLAEGQYPAKPTFPHILGRDGIGTVAATGEGVTGVKVGDRRLLLRSEAGVNRPGTFAERVAVPAEWLVAPPEGWSAEQSAGAPLVYLTAHQALGMWGNLSPGVVLVTGASGGVGVACVQLAKARLHTVIAMSRDAEKSKKLFKLGADLVVDPADGQWRKKVKEFLKPRRVDLAVDNIGGELFPQVIDTLGDQGKVSCVGRLAGPVPEFNTASLFFRRIRIGGVAIAGYTAVEARAAWREALDLMKEVGAEPQVDSVWEFERLKEAFERLRVGPMGKVVVRVGGRG
jgi:NADPH2:quinone reductase